VVGVNEGRGWRWLEITDWPLQNTAVIFDGGWAGIVLQAPQITPEFHERNVIWGQGPSRGFYGCEIRRGWGESVRLPAGEALQPARSVCVDDANTKRFIADSNSPGCSRCGGRFADQIRWVDAVRAPFTRLEVRGCFYRDCGEGWTHRAHIGGPWTPDPTELQERRCARRAARPRSLVAGRPTASRRAAAEGEGGMVRADSIWRLIIKAAKKA